MSSRTTPAAADPGSFLRKAFLADAVLSGVSGLVLLAAPGVIAARIGLRSPAIVAAFGVGLLVYAFGLVRDARRERMRREDAVRAIALNLGWIAVTAVVVGAGWLDRPGNWALLMVADVVLVFAILEGIGLRRLDGLGARAANPAA
jgi:uncharacterized protein (TIGR04206 family)